MYNADLFFTALANGAFTMDYWDRRNGTDSSSLTTAPDRATDYGDRGLLSSGASCERALNTPCPAYYALQMLSDVAQPATRWSTPPRTTRCSPYTPHELPDQVL